MVFATGEARLSLMAETMVMIGENHAKIPGKMSVLVEGFVDKKHGTTDLPLTAAGSNTVELDAGEAVIRKESKPILPDGS